MEEFPTPLWLQVKSLNSFPVQETLSSRIEPVPLPKKALVCAIDPESEQQIYVLDSDAEKTTGYLIKNT